MDELLKFKSKSELIALLLSVRESSRRAMDLVDVLDVELDVKYRDCAELKGELEAAGTHISELGEVNGFLISQLKAARDELEMIKGG